MRCPLCPDSVLIVSHRHGIEVDHCPTCRGVWLDRGELDHLVDSIAERLGPPPPTAAAPVPGPSTGDAGWAGRPQQARRPEPEPEPAWRSDEHGGGRRRKRRRHAVLDLLDDVLDL